MSKAKELNIKNLVVLRGDKELKEEEEDKNMKQHFNYANELVSYIREKYDYFKTIGVAGYPNKHPESKCFNEDINYLKQKIDCNANYVLTQIVYDANEFFEFVKRCRENGIKVPIIPGILPIHTLDSIKHIAKFCKINIPADFIDCLHENQKDEQANLNFSINYFVALCSKLLESKQTFGLHFYTMNNFKIVKNILSKLTRDNQLGESNEDYFFERSNLSRTHFLFKNFD